MFWSFFSHACDFMTSSYLFHAEGWSTLKEICLKGWSMIKVFIMRVFFHFFHARDLLTSCYLSFSGGWSKLKKIVLCLTHLGILTVFFELPLCFRLSRLLPLSSLIHLISLRFDKVFLFYSFLPLLHPLFLRSPLCLFINLSRLLS